MADLEVVLDDFVQAVRELDKCAARDIEDRGFGYCHIQMGLSNLGALELSVSEMEGKTFAHMLAISPVSGACASYDFDVETEKVADVVSKVWSSTRS